MRPSDQGFPNRWPDIDLRVLSAVFDDCDNEFLGSNTHMWQADSLANIINDNVQNFNINKIFLDNYNQISTPGGPRSPDAQNAINDL